MNSFNIFSNIFIMIFSINHTECKHSESSTNKFKKAYGDFNEFNNTNDGPKDKDDNRGYLVLIVKIKNNIDDVKETVKQIARQNYDEETKEDKLKDGAIQREHNEKIRQVVNFMANHMMTTNYFYDEVERIKKDRVVKDDLREMVAYLDKPKNAAMKQSILNFFQFNLNQKVIKKVTSMWDQKVNDLNINVLKDPFNHGLIN